jgi:hypothetical protein
MYIYGYMDSYVILLHTRRGLWLFLVEGLVLWRSSLLLLDTYPEVRVRFWALSDFQRSSGSGTGFTQPPEYI